MSGLRETIRRRGGLELTSRVVGGLWVVGERTVPEKPSPYNAAATAALKAAFPTQWPTIRDYGFAHPALVPFINEDPMLVMSLIDGLGTRRLENTSGSYIVLNLAPLKTDIIRLRVENTTQAQSSSIFGYYSGLYLQSWRSTISCNGQYAVNATEIGAVYDITLDSANFTVNETTKTYSRSNCAGNAALFAFYYNGYTQNWKGKVEFLNIERDGAVILEMYPFIRKINGVETCGMIDVLSGTFYQNAGSGSFTISETPAS